MVMESKEELIRTAIAQLLQVAGKYSRIEQLPIAVDRDTEVTTREAHVIQAIGERGEMNVTNLANRFGITKSAASQMAAKLTGKGFVEKKQALHSGKEFSLSLTDLGWRAFRAHETFHGKDLTDLIARLSTFSLSQIATISVMLESIGAVMDERLSRSPEE